MDTELEIQRLLSRVQELERENAILCKQLAALKSSDSLQKGIASAHHAAATFVNSKEPRGPKESKSFIRAISPSGICASYPYQLSYRKNPPVPFLVSRPY